ncbi:hypothetical protein HanRHA438_Chr11g0500581 [Helianthus annuus]|nr:hypothetical protein HanIR_Chr11g0524981 [Helianthus annuus]KAJ0870445.1 hypothetical protein HanRHA438_Chr11g0500581 [Helianthus annuus]
MYVTPKYALNENGFKYTHSVCLSSKYKLDWIEGSAFELACAWRQKHKSLSRGSNGVECSNGEPNEWV